MKILLLAATQAEIGPFLAHLESKGSLQHDIDVLITGVGLMATTWSLTKKLSSNSYDLVLQAGIAGSFDKQRTLGSLVVVKSEQLGDLGAEDGEDFIDIYSLGFGDPDAYPFTGGKLVNQFSAIPFPIADIPQVDGLTVSTVSGNEPTIQQRVQLYKPDIESMEGAALHYVCLQSGTPFLQVRAISNYVTRRDRSAWKIGKAITALNAQLIQWLAS